MKCVFLVYLVISEAFSVNFIKYCVDFINFCLYVTDFLSLIAPCFCLCMFCLQLCASRGVIRSMALVLYLENASESDKILANVISTVGPYVADIRATQNDI